MKQFFSIWLLLILTLTAGAQGPKTKAQAYVNRVARQEPLKGSVWGVLAMNSKGDTLARWNPGIRIYRKQDIICSKHRTQDTILSCETDQLLQVSLFGAYIRKFPAVHSLRDHFELTLKSFCGNRCPPLRP